MFCFCDGVGVDLDVVNLDIVEGLVIGIHRFPLHQIQALEPVDHSPKDGVQFVELRKAGVRDEELAIVCVGAAIGHRDHSSTVMLEGFHYLIFEGLLVDALSSLASVGGVSSLHNETLDIAMEESAVVAVGSRQGQEVLASLGRQLAVELDFDGPMGGVEGDGHGLQEAEKVIGLGRQLGYYNTGVHRQFDMGGSDSKIDIQGIPLEEIKGSSPIETTRFCPPFRKFISQDLQFNGHQMNATVGVGEPFRETIHIKQDVYADLEDAFQTKTKDIELEAVLFDHQYIDRKTYLAKEHGKDLTLQLRQFSNFNTHAFNQILYEIHINEQAAALNCPNLNTIKEAYIVQTGLELTGEEFPNTEVFEMQPVATNLSEIIKYRRANKWGWTVRQFNALASDLTKAVTTLHNANISHNDIRPCNVFYSTEKNCYQLGCFSNSFKTNGGQAISQVRTSTFFGAPELGVQSEADLQKADAYSLGMTLLCAFYLTEPVDRKNASAFNRKMESKYDVMKAIRQMIMPVEKRKTLAEISHKVPSGENSKKMKSLIQSLRYKNSPKDRKLIQTKKAMSEGYQKLGLWNEWKDNLNEAYDLEEGELDEYKKANSLCELAKIESCRGEVQSASEYSKTASKMFRGMGYTAYEQGNVNQALNFFTKAIECSKYYENQNDLDNAKNLQGLALAHAEKGDYEVSKPLINEAGRIVARSEGKDSVEYCRIRLSEAKIETDFGEFDSSTQILNECLNTSEQKIKFNQDLGLRLKAEILHKLGRNIMMASAYGGNQEEGIRRAEAYINDSISINEQFDDNHIALAANIDTFGEIDLRKQDYGAARTNFKKAQLLRDTYSADHNLVGSMEKERADNLCSIAACDSGIGDHGQALKNYNSALSIYRGLYGSDHNKYSAIAIGNMSKVYYKLNERGKTRECLRLATDILQDLLGRDDPDYEHFQHLADTLEQ